MNLRVIDISHHNTLTGGGFHDVAAFGILGVIHKASQGVSFTDSKYSIRRQAATDAGLLWGAYCYADGSDPVAQADFFLNAAKPDDNTLMALDYEPNGDNTMDIEGARAFMEHIDAALGRKCVLYSGNLIKETVGDDSDGFFGSHRLWLAQYSNNPKWPPAWDSYWILQFSDGSVNTQGIHVPGIAGQVDLNSYPNSDDQLRAEWA